MKRVWTRYLKSAARSAPRWFAAKNSDKEELVGEINDLLYHMIVLMAERGVTVEDVEAVMVERSRKIGNLKQFHVSDHNT